MINPIVKSGGEEVNPPPHMQKLVQQRPKSLALFDKLTNTNKNNNNNTGSIIYKNIYKETKNKILIKNQYQVTVTSTKSSMASISFSIFIFFET